MRMILDTSTGYGTACVTDVKGGGDKYAISSAVSSLKGLGYARFRCRTDPEPAIKAMVDAAIKCLSDDRVVEQILPEETIPEQACATRLAITLKKRCWNCVFERMKSEPGCFVKKGVTHKDTIIVVLHVDDLLSVGKRKHLDNFFVQLEKTLKLKRVEFIDNGKSVLFLGDYITKFKDKITLKRKDAHVDNMLAMLGMESCKPTSTPMVRKECVANVNGIHPAPDIHEHFTIHKGYGTLRISSRTTSTILSTL